MRTIVRAYDLRYSSSLLRSGDMDPIGFAVELLAEPPRASHLPTPDCELCPPARAALRDLVHYLLPNGPHAFFELHFPISIVYSNHGGARLSALIEILHPSGVNRPIDDCERACRDEIVDRLRSLGAREGS